MNDNSDLTKDLEDIGLLIWALEKKLKQTHEDYHELNKSSADHLDLTALDYFQCDIEAFRIDEIVTLIKLQKEAKEAAEAEEYDNDNPGDLSYDQMDLKVGRG